MTDNERLAVLETDFKHMSREMDKVARQVDEMHAVLLQVKGVRWTIIAIMGVVTAVSSIGGWFIGRH